ncbi:MAG: anaerobic selenocysteine-containing dehydrogenase [Chitinophagales bacterium]|jgi:anaerobic selenocysteine-containing dehydrogenase
MKTYCRICEAHCGLDIDIDSNTETILKIRADKTHPVSRGYACIKGIGLDAIHHDSQRLNHPLKKVGNSWQQISWPQAIEEIGAKVKALAATHSPRSIAMYAGNPTFFNFKSVMFVHDFLKSIGSSNLFSSHSIDVNNKLFTATKVYGRSMVHPIPDFDNTQFFMCLGSNPVVSQMSFLLIPNALGELQKIEQRGGKVVIVDPRKTETAEKVGEHVFIRPSSDVYLLLAMLNIMAAQYLPDLDQYDYAATDIEAFIAIGKEWTPERCAELTGISALSLRELARQYFTADGAVLYMSTGVNMGPFGSICYWLIQGLSLLSGNLDSKGGLIFSQGPFDAVQLAEDLGIGGEEDGRTLQDGWGKVASCFPSNALADEILIDHPEKIRALFVLAGNPVHSIPGNNMPAAMAELELVVSIDIYQNETAMYADYILPATDMLERSDFPISWTSLRSTPFTQYTKRVIAPKFERREEWEILSDLAIACGASPFALTTCNALAHINRWLNWLPGDLRLTPDHILALLLKKGGRTTLKQLRDAPQGVPLPAPPVGLFLGVQVPTIDNKMQLAPVALMEDLSRLDDIAQRLLQQQGLVLIGQRERKTHNSWMHSSPFIKHKNSNAVLINPADALARNVTDGDIVTLAGNNSELQLPVKITENIMPGVVVVPHGWGHAASGVASAQQSPGENINYIIPGGNGNIEPVSGQAIIHGHSVELSKVT